MRALAHRTAITTAHDEAAAWRQALREGVVTGSLAGILSTAVLALAGARQNRSAVAPINAASHWIWGDESLPKTGPRCATPCPVT